MTADDRRTTFALMLSRVLHKSGVENLNKPLFAAIITWEDHELRPIDRIGPEWTLAADPASETCVFVRVDNPEAFLRDFTLAGGLAVPMSLARELFDEELAGCN